MARTITILSKVGFMAEGQGGQAYDTSSIGAGTGTGLTGQPSNRKIRVTAFINVSSYTANGEILAPLDLDLLSMDFCEVNVLTVAGAVPTAAAPLTAVWDRSHQKIIVNTTHGTESPGSAATLTVEAIGDTPQDVVAL
jgi:hypothetical protein